MRILSRNKKDLWYANVSASSYVTDNNGLKTGEKEVTYTTPVKVRMSMAISSGANNLGSQGMVVLDPFRITTAYTHRMVTEDMDCPINEESLIWIDKTPTEGAHNFKIVRVAKSLNHIIYYAKEVDVSGEAD